MTWHLEDPRKYRGKNRAGLSFKEKNPLPLREPGSAKMHRTDPRTHGLH